MDNYDNLKLENQLCFPLYAVSKEIIKKYRPFLDKINLTYTQYITMMVLWEHKTISVKTLGEKLFLDSGTLTPMLKNLEQKEFIKRKRSNIDERVLNISITPKGEKLKDKASEIPNKMANCLNLTESEANQMYSLLYKILKN